MRRPRHLTALWLAAVAWGCAALYGAAHADSLWKTGSGSSPSLFTDQKAHAVGDLVTIVIAETSSATQQANTSVTKKEQTDVAKGVGPLLSLLPKLGFGASGSSTATGSTSRSSNLNARITAKVVAVKPNGDLALEGTRDIGTNNDVQIVKISGVVRARDIGPDNTVLSSYIADAAITYTGRGPVAERQKPGFISRLLKVIF